MLCKVLVAVMLQLYLAEGQTFTSCAYDSSTCSGHTNLGRLNLNNATQSTPYVTYALSVFYWNPCSDFDMSGITAGAIQQPGGSSIDIGVHKYASCDVNEGNIRFNMISNDESRFTYVTCLCGSGSSFFTYDSESPSNNFNFVLTSTACCPISGGLDVTVTVSVGWIMVIAFFSVLLAYILFGTIFQVAYRKAEGRERVPNVGFWTELPGLIKDGCVFTFTRGRRGGYDTI